MVVWDLRLMVVVQLTQRAMRRVPDIAREFSIFTGGFGLRFAIQD